MNYNQKIESKLKIYLQSAICFVKQSENHFFIYPIRSVALYFINVLIVLSRVYMAHNNDETNILISF